MTETETEPETASPPPPPQAPGLSPADHEEAARAQLLADEIRMISAPCGQIAEQFRSLRNSITALNPDGASRTLVVTSSISGEGKTVSTVNLAVALAELPGNQILVVDGNLHQPALERYFGQERHQGLADVLRGQCSLDAAIRPTSIERLMLMGAGTLPENPSKLLGSDRTRTVLKMLKQRFSYVLIDTPGATSKSDASLLGAIVDGILLVIRMSFTPKHMVEQAYNQLETLGGNVLGTCLTGGEESGAPRE